MGSVIVFGPTGNIASIAARTAHELGAKVYLAMRDPQKAIPGLSPEEESSGGFERIQADLTKPETVAAAVKTSGAKRIFIYVAHGTPDHMKSTIEALKSAGVEFLVFLSSYTIHGEASAVEPSEIIPYVHAQVELNLDSIFGPENYVAIRPGRFATNMLRQKSGINAGEVKLYGDGFKLDCITPTDMGRVSGRVLAKGPLDGQRKIYVFGPQLLTQAEAVKIIAKALGKDVNIVYINEDEARKQFQAFGSPPPMVEYMLKASIHPDYNEPTDQAQYEEGLENVRKYTGQPNTTFQQWVEENKDRFV